MEIHHPLRGALPRQIHHQVGHAPGDIGPGAVQGVFGQRIRPLVVDDGRVPRSLGAAGLAEVSKQIVAVDVDHDALEGRVLQLPGFVEELPVLHVARHHRVVGVLLVDDGQAVEAAGAKVEIVGRHIQPLLLVADRDFLVDLRDPVPLRVPGQRVERAHAPGDFQFVGIVGVDRLVEPNLHLTAALDGLAGVEPCRVPPAHVAYVGIARPQILRGCRGAQRAGHGRCACRQHAPLHHRASGQL